jgi:hypothetical protein
MTSDNIKLILHIGQHKTGSKALQSFLTENSGALSNLGVYYPCLNPNHTIKAFSISHFKLFALLRYEAMQKESAAQDANNFWSQHQNICSPHTNTLELFSDLRQQCSRKNANLLVLSAEDIFDMHTAHETDFNPYRISIAAKNLQEACSKHAFDPVIVLYVRRQDYLLVAHYNQYIKSSTLPDLDFDTFSEAFLPRLQTLKILQIWTEVFGKDKVIIRPYERDSLPGGIVPDFFNQVLGFSAPSHWRIPKRDIESVNATPSRDYLEFIHLQKKWDKATSRFPQELVLEASLKHKNSGLEIAEWLSPASRLSLLDIHDQDNRMIREIYLGEKGKSVFLEKLPDPDSTSKKYPGLAPEKAMEIAWEVHQLLFRQIFKRRMLKIGKVSIIGLILLLSLLFLFYTVR